MSYNYMMLKSTFNYLTNYSRQAKTLCVISTAKQILKYKFIFAEKFP